MKQRKTEHYLIKRSVFLLSGLSMAAGVLLLGHSSLASWIEIDNGTKYELEGGNYATGFSEIDGKRYYFDKDGYLVKGKFYVEAEDAYYYADKKGVIQTGIIQTKKVFYIADETGKLQTGFMEYEGKRYYFGTDAKLVTGWFQSEGSWYYADDQGVVLTGFLTLDGYRYYLNEDGARVSDAVMEIDGVTYIFNSDGSVDENATALYPVYQYIFQTRKEKELSNILMNTKVQACAILRAADLVNGYVTDEGDAIERLLRNRGVKCSGGYEFSYGGVEGYDLERLCSDMQKDTNLAAVLSEADVTEVGLGVYQQDEICYYDIIFVSAK